MRWAFWRTRSSEPPRALPDDVGLPTSPRPPAAPRDPDDSHPPIAPPLAPRTSGATPAEHPTDHPMATDAAPLTTPAPALDRAQVAAAGADVARIVNALLGGTSAESGTTDQRSLAVAATGALAARLPALSGVDGAVLDEPEDELLHAYADLLVSRAQRRTSAAREDLLAVAHVAAAAAAVDAAADPALLLLAGVPADAQLRAAAALLAQTADDGGGAPDRLVGEVRELFATQG